MTRSPIGSPTLSSSEEEVAMPTARTQRRIVTARHSDGPSTGNDQGRDGIGRGRGRGRSRIPVQEQGQEVGERGGRRRGSKPSTSRRN